MLSYLYIQVDKHAIKIETISFSCKLVLGRWKHKLPKLYLPKL